MVMGGWGGEGEGEGGTKIRLHSHNTASTYIVSTNTLDTKTPPNLVSERTEFLPNQKISGYGGARPIRTKMYAA